MKIFSSSAKRSDEPSREELDRSLNQSTSQSPNDNIHQLSNQSDHLAPIEELGKSLNQSPREDLDQLLNKSTYDGSDQSPNESPRSLEEHPPSPSSNSSPTQSTVKRTKNHRPNLTNAQRQRIYELLLEGSVLGQLPHGILGRIGKKFNVTTTTVSRIWHQGRKSVTEGDGCANVKSKIAANCGRKKLPIDLNLIESVPQEHRKSLQSLSKYTNIPKTRLYRAFKENIIKKGDYYYVPKTKGKGKRKQKEDGE